MNDPRHQMSEEIMVDIINVIAQVWVYCGSDRHRTSISIDKNEAAVMNLFDVLSSCLNIVIAKDTHQNNDFALQERR